MIVTIDGERSLRRYRLVIAQKSKLRLTPEVQATFASHGRDHRLTASGFFPCSIDREYLYGYAADGYRSPFWLCASRNGSHQALQDRKLLAIPGIHYFDAHRLRAHLLQASELQLHPRTSNVTGPEGAGDAVEDYSSDEERDTTDAETNAEAEAEESWCLPIPDTPDDPTESEIAGAADKLATMLRGSQPQMNIFFRPDNSWRPPGVVATGEIGIHCFKCISVFFLWCGRLRSQARSLQEKKLLKKLQHGHRWSHEIWQIITTEPQTKRTKKARRRSPSHICVSPSQGQQSKQRKRQEPNRNNHKREKEICQGHSGKNPLCRN